MSSTQQKAIPVAEFRRCSERLLRKIGDYHACCSAGEVESWKEVTQRVLAEVSNNTCSRAKAEDLEARASAIASVEKYLCAADERIAAYNADKAEAPEIQPPAKFHLRLIQGGKLH